MAREMKNVTVLEQIRPGSELLTVCRLEGHWISKILLASRPLPLRREGRSALAFSACRPERFSLKSVPRPARGHGGARR